MYTRHSLVFFAAVCLAMPSSARDEDVVLTSLTGIVRDAEGKPIAGAVVRLDGTEGYTQTRAGTPARGRGTTDAEGKYTLSVFTKPGEQVRVKAVTAEARGFIRFRDEYHFNEPILLPGKTTRLDFTLARGEVLAGTIEIPLTTSARRAGEKPAEQWHIFVVRGPSFKQFYGTQAGGAFEAWVPPGRYTIEWVGPPGRPAVRMENVPSGSRGLKLALADPPVPGEVLTRAFDALWEHLGRNYSYLDLKKVDWKAIRERYRPRAAACRTLRALVGVLEEMLGELRDGHVRLTWPEETIYPSAPPARPNNYNRKVTQDALERETWCGDFAVVGKTKSDGFGAFLMMRQSKADKDSVRQVVEFIHSMKDAPGFIVDLRDANGGNELLARDIARQFCGTDVVYAKSKYRDGPLPTDFGPTYDRALMAGDRPFLKPVVCLIGPRCVSSGEGFAQMMKCLPHVTTVGTRTRGSSGNPGSFQLPGVEVTVWYSRWVDLMPDGTPIEGAGIAPDVEVNAPPEVYADKDPTWEKALDVLRKKAKKGEREP
jgi:hypothetical protein